MKKQIGILTMEDYECREKGTVGSSRIRGEWLAKYWDEAEMYQIGERYEVIIFQKVYWQVFLEEFKGIKILDLCDPDLLQGVKLVELMSHCDACTVSTKALARLVRMCIKDKPVVVIPDRIDFSAHPTPKKKHFGRLKEAVWFGYSHNFDVIKPCITPLRNKKVRLRVISNKPFKHADKNFVLKNWNTDVVHEELIKSDIAIMPAYKTKMGGRFSFKSNNKTLTCWALGIPVATEITDIERFMGFKARKAEADVKLKLVKEKYDIRKSVEQYKQLINDIKNAKKN